MKNWVVGNWKMNGSWDMIVQYVPEFLKGLQAIPDWQSRLQVVICPPFPYLATVAKKLNGQAVLVGAQDVHPKVSGAFTGEVSAPMLLDMDIRVCIVGHSERRQLFGETDETGAEKISSLLESGITPILCVGETLAEREAGRQNEVVMRQVEVALRKMNEEQFERLVIAYEPVWAIGTGRTASPEQANDMHTHIRELLRQRMEPTQSAAIPILYGGSVNPDNAGELMAQPEINGALVGGASLKSESFIPIIHSSVN